MDPLSLLKSLMKPELKVQPDVFRLRPGQIISGKILRFLPNQLAEIQIGSHKLIAKLEASLPANQPYLFQVQSGEGKIRLKLVRGNGDGVSFGAIKEASESLPNQAGRPEGQIEQLVTQIPIKLGDDTSDLIMQWNGRKKEDGKMDSDYCRIFLYFNLKNIGEIFVDLQIQNRKMSINILNDTANLKVFAEPEITILREKLQSISFELSSIKIDQHSGGKIGKRMIKKPSAGGEKNQHTGVDIRI